MLVWLPFRAWQSMHITTHSEVTALVTDQLLDPVVTTYNALTLGPTAFPTMPL